MQAAERSGKCRFCPWWPWPLTSTFKLVWVIEWFWPPESTLWGYLLRSACILYVNFNKPVDWYITSMTTTEQQPFYGPLSGTTQVSRYQKKHSPTHHPDHYPIFISFFHLPRSIASSLFKLRICQSFCTTSLHVLFGLPLDLEPLHLIFHTFLHPISVFFLQHARTIATCFGLVSILYHLFLVFQLLLHIHLTIFISGCWSATSFLPHDAAMLARSWES